LGNPAEETLSAQALAILAEKITLVIRKSITPKALEPPKKT